MKFDLRKHYDEVLNEFYRDPADEAEYKDITWGFNFAMIMAVLVLVVSVSILQIVHLVSVA